MQKRWILFSFILIFVLGSFLRFYQLNAKSIWLDEGFSIRLSKWSIPQIIVGEKNAPPLYHILLHYWMILWGNSENATRSLSAIFGILSIPLLFAIAKKLYNQQIALTSTALLAFSSFHIYYAQETRMYTQLVFFTLLSIIFLLYSLDKNKWFIWIGYIISNLVVLYTHYYGVFLVGAEVLLLVILWRQERSVHKAWLISQILIILLYIPWLSIMLSVVGEGGQTWRSHLNLRILETFFSFSLGYSTMILDAAAKHYPITTLITNLPIIILFCLSFGILFCLGMKKSLQNRTSAIMLFSLLFVIMGTAALISLKIELYHPAYLILCSPMFYIFLAIGIHSINNKYFKRFEIGLVSVLILFSLWGYYFNPHFGKDQYRDVAEFITENEQSSEIILLHKPSINCAFNYYYQGQLAEYKLPYQVISETSPDFIKTKDIIQHHQRFWLIISQNFDTGSAYPDLMTKYYRLILKKDFTINNGITVYLFQV